uniref:Uncharacterized protein n=1 Tax=Fagus sylvatica TaxID=28930 RepID=A0A2N9IHP0_FAGSY
MEEGGCEPLILHALGCPEKFFGWVKTCISTPKYSIAENGGLVGFSQADAEGCSEEEAWLPH